MGTRGEGERKKGAGKSSGELPTFKIGRRITQRAQLRSEHESVSTQKVLGSVLAITLLFLKR